MRYFIRGLEVKSENAAKPTSTPNRWLLDWIGELPPNYRVLDLGCGKLRYTIPLAHRVTTVVAVDSTAQIDRLQTISGEAGWSVRAYAAARLRNVQVHTVDEAAWRRLRFDRVLVAFVLSAIPNRVARLNLLRSAKEVVKRRGGEILVVTNFANSRYKNWQRNDLADSYRDGYVIQNRTGVSFYGMIPLDRLRGYCELVGLEIVRAGTFHGENAYVFARLGGLSR